MLKRMMSAFLLLVMGLVPYAANAQAEDHFKPFVLAYRGIVADIKLIRSADRLR